ncbi:uncharacterized protein VK521_001359 [Ammospiza maritima maritima]
MWEFLCSAFTLFSPRNGGRARVTILQEPGQLLAAKRFWNLSLKDGGEKPSLNEVQLAFAAALNHATFRPCNWLSTCKQAAALPESNLFTRKERKLGTVVAPFLSRLSHSKLKYFAF